MRILNRYNYRSWADHIIWAQMEWLAGRLIGHPVRFTGLQFDENAPRDGRPVQFMATVHPMPKADVTITSTKITIG